jgi:peptidoglycan/xylan/chitin deacetylase (PgdA/CDA1 family)
MAGRLPHIVARKDPLVTPKRFAKIGISCGWFVAAGAIRLLTRRPYPLTILYYHAVPADQRAAFAAQMRRLRQITTVVGADHHQPGGADRPTVAVTFDDAFRTVRENALPALVAHRIAATIFVPTGYLGRAPGWAMETCNDQAETVMSADELRALPADLISIGSHTVDHPRLSTLPPDAMDAQLQQSRAALEEALGRTIDTLAFPYGDHDDAVVERCRAAGYRQVYTVAPEAIDLTTSRIKRGRTAADPADGTLEFFLKARGAYSWMPIASRIKRRLRGANGRI